MSILCAGRTCSQGSAGASHRFQETVRHSIRSRSGNQEASQLDHHHPRECSALTCATDPILVHRDVLLHIARAIRGLPPQVPSCSRNQELHRKYVFSNESARADPTRLADGSARAGRTDAEPAHAEGGMWAQRGAFRDATLFQMSNSFASRWSASPQANSERGWNSNLGFNAHASERVSGMHSPSTLRTSEGDGRTMA